MSRLGTRPKASSQPTKHFWRAMHAEDPYSINLALAAAPPPNGLKQHHAYTGARRHEIREIHVSI